MRNSRELVTKLNNDAIDTIHVLQALWMEETGVASNVLKNLGIRPAAFKRVMAKYLSMGNTKATPNTSLPFTKSMKDAFTSAAKSAKQLGHNLVGTEHLLLGILHAKGTAYEALSELGVTLEAAQNETINLLGDKDYVGPYKDAPQKVINPKHRRSQREAPFIDKFCNDLTMRARESKLDPCIGRVEERKRVIQILGRKTKNNPVLIGEPGVGKAKVIEGLAIDIVSGNVPESLRGKRVVAVDLAAMVAGTKYRGQFEERIKGLMKEVIGSKDIVLFFDELHTVVGAGGSEGGMDAANILKPALARGDLQCIGATTLDEYRKHIEKDGALERRFQPIIVEPPTPQQTLEILRGLQDSYERHHNVSYTDGALKQAVVLSDKYISDRFHPDKAIDVIDEAGSRVRIDASFKPEELQEQEKRLEELEREKDIAVRRQEFEAAAKLRDACSSAEVKVEELTEAWKSTNADVCVVVDEETIAEIVAGMTGIPLTSLSEEESKRLLRIEEELHRSVVSQHDAIVKISQAIKRARAGLKNPKKPTGSFLFVGPTGVGKTLLCKSLAKFLFGSEDHLVQIDMSEYMEKHSASRLIGAPPGYVGFEEGGQLTEKIRRRPYSVILLDEIEKAHPEIFNMLLQIMEEGKLTDSFGRTINFKNTIVIMTSNEGSDLIKSSTSLGFTTNTQEEQSTEASHKILMEAVERRFRPEFINRLDDIISFVPLTKDDLRQIVDIELADVVQRLKNLDLEFELSEDAKEFLITEGWSEVYGARPLKRAIEKYLENPMSEAILRGEFKEASKVTAVVGESSLTFNVERK
jgi:ATP-dependent Clp protease ATP-binding subunit ClpC